MADAKGTETKTAVSVNGRNLEKTRNRVIINYVSLSAFDISTFVSLHKLSTCLDTFERVFKELMSPVSTFLYPLDLNLKHNTDRHQI